MKTPLTPFLWHPRQAGQNHPFRRSWRPLATGLLSLSLIGAGFLPYAWPKIAPAVAVAHVAQPNFNRLSGSNREQTAVAVSRATFAAGSDAVVLVDGTDDHLIDGALALPLAHALHAPVLLLGEQGGAVALGQTTRDELLRLGAKRVYLVGRADDAALRAQLGNVQVVGLAGDNRYQTSDAVAQFLLQLEGRTSFDTVFGTVSVAPITVSLLTAVYAAQQGSPLLLLAPQQAPDVQKLDGSSTVLYQAGTEETAKLPGAIWLDASDLAAFVARLAQTFPAHGSVGGVVLVNGSTDHAVDMLAAESLVATNGATLLPVDGESTLPADYVDLLHHQVASATVTAIGSASIVSDRTAQEAVDRLRRLIRCTEGPRDSLAAGTPTRLTFQVTDGWGQPLNDKTLRFDVTGDFDPSMLTERAARTDSNGRASVTLTVPQVGVQGAVTASIEGTSSFASTTELQTVLPADAQVVLVDAPQVLSAGVWTPIRFRAVASNGLPLAGCSLHLSLTGTMASSGKLREAFLTTDDSGLATAWIFDDGAGDSGDVIAAMVGSNAYASAPIQEVVVNEATIAVDPAGETELGAGRYLPVTFTVRTPQGQPLEGVQVDFATTGSLSADVLRTKEGVSDAEGRATALVSDSRVGDSGQVIGTVHGTNLRTSSGLLTVGVDKGAQIAVPDEYTITAGRVTPLTFVVRDAFGDPVEGAMVDFGTGGDFSQDNLSEPTGKSDVQGQVTVRLTDVHVGDKGTVTATLQNTTVSQTTQAITVISGNAAITAEPYEPQVTAGTVTGFTLVIKDEAGHPLVGVPVQFGTLGDFTVSQLTSDHAVSDAAGEVRVGLQDKTVGDKGSLVATLQGTNISTTVGPLTVETPAEGSPAPTAPASITCLTTEPVDVNAGSWYEVSFVVKGSDGHPLKNAPVHFHVVDATPFLDDGNLDVTSGVTDAQGVVHVQLRSFWTFESGKIEASLSDAPNISVKSPQLSIVLPEDAEIASLNTVPSVGVMDTAVQPPLVWVVKDGAGEPLIDVPVVFLSTQGSFAPPAMVTLPNGTVITVFTPSTTGRLTVRANIVGTLKFSSATVISLPPVE